MKLLRFCITAVLAFVLFISQSEAQEKAKITVRKYGERNTRHLYEILHSQGNPSDEFSTKKALEKLVKIYNDEIKPLEEAYKFNDISMHAVGGGEIYAVPRVVFVGPWSTGKSSLINFLLGIENSSMSLISGAQPTTSDFTVLSYEEEHKKIDGSVLVIDSSYSTLEKFGHKFLERLDCIHIPKTFLKSINFIDTPGIIENRKQQERGYPFSEVCQWFVDRSDLVILVFDPTKLDVGVELEELFKKLREHESKVRIVLNKADTLTHEELLRVYGTLYWSLAPLINTTEPPRVYVGSFWSKQFLPVLPEFRELFIQDEISLVQDIFEVLCNRIQNKIAFLRSHAVMVRNHALVVDQYLKALNEHRSFLQNENDVITDILYTPDKYMIFQKVTVQPEVSKLDLYSAIQYRNFFRIHPLNSFKPLSKHCGYIHSCLLDSLNYAIHHSLPDILESLELTKKKECRMKSKTRDNFKEKVKRKTEL